MIIFSIVIPLYNKQEHIIQTLESLKKQSYNNFELLIIDDGSTDNSIQTVKNWIKMSQTDFIFPIRYISQKNSGVSSARNRGAKEANHQYVAFLDADDYWKETHLYNLKCLIEKYSNIVDIFSCSMSMRVDGKEKKLQLDVEENFCGVLDYLTIAKRNHGYIHSSSVCVKKEILLKNPFPIDMKFAEDLVTWATICNTKGVAFSAQTTAVYVIDNAQASVLSDFSDFIRFERYVMGIPHHNKKVLKNYVNSFLLLTILTTRINLSYMIFFKQSALVFAKSKTVSIYTFVAMLIPKTILRLLRKIRAFSKYDK